MRGEAEGFEQLLSVLPEGWESKAKELGALSRGRKIKRAVDLLRLIFIYMSEGKSFSGTAALLNLSEICSMTKKAEFTRFQKCGTWLQWLCEHIYRNNEMIGTPPEWLEDWKVYLVDASDEAKFWLGIMNELKTRGVNDFLIAAVDGLSGFPDAINTVFPKTEVQLCMVHMVRNSVKYISYKDRKEITSDLKEIYLAPSDKAAETALERFAEKWDGKYPAISKSWRSRWNEVIPFFKFSSEIRKAVYTTNAIESINYNLQRNLKTRQSFPSDESAMKLMFMILRRISKRWTMPIRDWGQALHQFAIEFGNERVPF